MEDVLDESVLCGLLELDSKDIHIIEIKKFCFTDVAEGKPTTT